MLATLGAPQRRLLRKRKPAAVDSAEEPTPVPTARATFIAAQPFDSEDAAAAWLDGLKADGEATRQAVSDALRALNGVLRAHRAATLDPYVRDVSATNALAVRVGYGAGEQVADGRFTAAYELPSDTVAEWLGSKRRQSFLQPQERLGAVLGGRDQVLAGEELLLRARADLNAERHREAALQARIALEALIAELGSEGRDVGELGGCRAGVGDAANGALADDLAPKQVEAVTAAVDAMERALRHRAAGA